MKQPWKNESKDSLEEECAQYFRGLPVFEPVFQGFREKYASYGALAGTVKLQGLQLVEIESLEGFFQKNYHGKKTISISAADFEKALKTSKFEGFSPVQVLELYFGERLYDKKEERLREAAGWDKLYSCLRREYAGTGAESWLEEMEEQKGDIRTYVTKVFHESGGNFATAEEFLRLGCEIICKLPYLTEQKEYLAVFSARLTGNPHSFDGGTAKGKLLQLLIMREMEKKGVEIAASKNFPAMKKQRAYLEAGILIDDVSNYIMVSGLRGFCGEREHLGMAGFFEEGQMVQVPLAVLAEWSHVACREQQIFIVENPSVYAMLVSKWKKQYTFMCMNGQPRLSSVLLLDLLAKAGTKIFYGGDFDPEGLLIAQRIKDYYKGEVIFWHMSREDYHNAISPSKISQRRLSMLERIKDPVLLETAEEMKAQQRAGYQENIWSSYLEMER